MNPVRPLVSYGVKIKFPPGRRPSGPEAFYSTVDQRILGDERFVQKVSKKARKTEIRGRKRHQYTLPEIAEAVQRVYGVSLNQLREKGKNEALQCGRKVMSLVAKDYGYKI